MKLADLNMRFIRGASCYWAIGKNFVARLPSDYVADDGSPRPDIVRNLAHRDSSIPTDSDTYSMTVLVTTRCNLACPYCFQNTELPGTPDGGLPVRIPGATVDSGKVTSILAFTRRRMAELSKTRLRLMLFGGEPTMFLDYCLQLLRGCSGLGLDGASMISNGTLLTVPAAIAMENAGLKWVQITFDGDSAAHDKSRVTIGGRGTFDQILNNVKAASLATELAWRLRVNLSADSINSADTLIDRLSGRLDTSKFTIKLALVQDTGIGYQNSIQHSEALAERVSALYMQAMSAGFTVAAPRVTVCTFCAAVGGTTGAVVNSDDVLYSCCHSAGQRGYDLGSVTAGYLPADIVRARWVNCGYEAEKTIDKEAERRYMDIIDAAILDGLYARGLLSPTTKRQFASMDPA